MTEWLREHKKAVFLLALLAMVGTGLWGSAHHLWEDRGQEELNVSGGYFSLDGSRHYVSPENLMALRARLSRFYDREYNAFYLYLESDYKKKAMPEYYLSALRELKESKEFQGRPEMALDKEARKRAEAKCKKEVDARIRPYVGRRFYYTHSWYKGEKQIGGQLQGIFIAWPVSPPDGMRYLQQRQICQEFGFDLGKMELEALVKNEFQEHTGQEKVNSQMKSQALLDLQMSLLQFEDLVRGRQQMARYEEALEQACLPEGVRYLHYALENAGVRLIAKAFESKDYEAQVGAPTPEELKEDFAELSKTPLLSMEARYAVDVLHLPVKTVEQQLQPTQEELRKFYLEKRRDFWQKPVAPGAPPPAGEEGFKPFEEVKDQVVLRYREDKKTEKAGELFKKYSKEAEEEEAKLPAGKALDLAAFAQARGLQHWRTEPATLKEFQRGESKFKAPVFRHAVELASLATKGDEERAESELEKERKQFRMSWAMVGEGAEQGYFALRLAPGWTPPRPMTEEEAKPVLVQRRARAAAQVKAREAAEALRRKWAAGEDLPKPSEVRDEWHTRKSPFPPAVAYFERPVGPGRTLAVDSKGEPTAETREDQSVNRCVFWAAYVAEQRAPSLEKFREDHYYTATHLQEQMGLLAQRAYQRTAEGADFLGLLRLPSFPKDWEYTNPFAERRRGGPSPAED